MIRTRVFDVLEARGQKQRWLLNEMAHRGYNLSESYLSQIKSRSKSPSPRFVSLASEIMSLPEDELFYEQPSRACGFTRVTSPTDQLGATKMEPINVAIEQPSATFMKSPPKQFAD